MKKLIAWIIFILDNLMFILIKGLTLVRELCIILCSSSIKSVALRPPFSSKNVVEPARIELAYAGFYGPRTDHLGPTCFALRRSPRRQASGAPSLYILQITRRWHIYLSTQSQSKFGSMVECMDGDG